MSRLALPNTFANQKFEHETLSMYNGSAAQKVDCTSRATGSTTLYRIMPGQGLSFSVEAFITVSPYSCVRSITNPG